MLAMQMPLSKQVPDNAKGRWIILQIAFVLWLIAINFFYYFQFKSLFLARFASLKHR